MRHHDRLPLSVTRPVLACIAMSRCRHRASTEPRHITAKATGVFHLLPNRHHWGLEGKQHRWPASQMLRHECAPHRWLHDALPCKVPDPAGYRTRRQNSALSGNSQQSQPILLKPAQNPRIPRIRPRIPLFALRGMSVAERFVSSAVRDQRVVRSLSVADCL